MREKRNFKSGFTLLELSLVIFLMAVLLGFSLPRFSNLFETTLQKETQKIALIMRDLRNQAVLKGENYKLVFDTMRSEYSILVMDTKDPTKYFLYEKFPEPIELARPVEFLRIIKGDTNSMKSKFGFESLEFDKIFGQTYEFRIDSLGCIDIFSVKLTDQNDTLTLSVVNILGKIEISQDIPQ